MSWRLMKNLIFLLITLLLVQGSVLSQSIVRGPYLQKATSTSMLVRWYTDVSSDSRVTYGTDPGNLSQSVTMSDVTTNHAVELTGLNPYTKYYYSVGSSTGGVIQSGLENYFLTSPLPNATGKYTFWVTGDAGDGSARQKTVRDRFNNYMGDRVTNGWLLLGDNAYDNGTEQVYTSKFFEIYQTNIMRKSPLWPATGNHEYANSVARQIDQNIPYFGIFDLPTNGEAGGVPSNSEAYYSFDYGNIHFVALDSYIIENNVYRLFDLAGPQVQWLKQDLASNTKKWTIVYFHHPPYSMGSHNSDTELQMVKIRENIVPILEQYDVDLVLTGHSHSYERSKLMKGHFGMESTFDPLVHHLSQSSGKYNGTTNSCTYVKDSPSSHGGTVYIVSGSAGLTDYGQTGRFPHDAMYFGNDLQGGSLILEIEANRLDGKWLYENGQVLDQFTIMKNVNQVNTVNLNLGESISLEPSWVGAYNWSSGQSSNSVTVTPASSTTYTVTDPNQCITDTYNINVGSAPETIDVSAIGFTEICAGSNVNISFASSATFSLDNTFALQLSNSAGSFSSPSDIGILSGTASGTINGIIPANMPAGSNYRVRVVSTNPVITTGSPSDVFSISSPAAPTVGIITQPTCTVSTGSVVLSNLPASGLWTLTRTPGGFTTTGNGTSATVSNLAAGSYTYKVTNASTCVSPSSTSVLINAQPITPTAPTVGAITQPTCSVSTGNVALGGLPSSGTWTLSRNPGGATITGTGTSTTISLLSPGTYTYTVINAFACASPASVNVLINAQPITPTAPIVGLITQPTCTTPTGSVGLSGLPSSGWTINPGSFAGSGASTTITGLAIATTYNFTVSPTATGCTSTSSINVVINSVPGVATPTVGAITQPSCAIPIGSVALSGLPSGSWVINPGAFVGSGQTTTLTGLLPSTTYAFTVTETLTGCVSAASSSVIIMAAPITQAAPAALVTTQPTCSVAATITVTFPVSGIGISYTIAGTSPVRAPQSNATGIFSGLAAGDYDVTTTINGCISHSTPLTVDDVPGAPNPPTISLISQPTCTVPSGSVTLSGLPSGPWMINPGAISGSGTTTTITGLSLSTTYNFSVVELASGCNSSASANVVINAQPIQLPPTLGAVTQPTCIEQTGSVVLTGLPSSGTWTLTKAPGGASITGTGTTTTISGLSAGTYSYKVANVSGCISTLSANLVINAQPTTPSIPTVGIITQPTCSVATGSFVLGGLPSSGTWTLTRTPGGVTSTGSGTSATISGLTEGNYTYTVTNVTGCTSVPSPNVVISAKPLTPVAPTVGIITQPTCTVATGGIVLNDLPSSGIWTLIRAPGGVTTTGTGTSAIFSGLETGTYTYTVTNASTCSSPVSANLVINAQPETPTAPMVGSITHPTCSVATGSVILNSLPSTGTWTLTETPGGVVTAGTGTTRSISGLSSGIYTYSVTNASGCVSTSSADVVINASLSTPSAPTIGSLTLPTCSVGTGSIVLANLPTSGTWILTKTPGGVTTTGTGAFALITGLAPGTYTYTVTNYLGCISSASANAVINSKPVIPAPPVVSDIAYCLNATATALTATALSGHTLVWYNTNKLDEAPKTISPIPTTVATGVTTYYVSQKNNTTGCEGDRSGIVVTINPLPTPPIVSDFTYCQNATASSLTATALPDHILVWYGTDENGGTSSSVASLPSTTLVGTRDYYVSQVSTTSGCNGESVRAKISVTVNSLPAPPIVSDITYCMNASAVELPADVFSDHTLAWYGTNATGGIRSTVPPLPSTIADGTTDYYVSQYNNATGCESERAVITVVVKATPKPSISATGIGSGNVVLNSSASHGNQWFKDEVIIAGATTQTYAVSNNGVYHVQAHVDGCVSALSEPFAVIVTAIADVEPISLKLFPVPAHQFVTIQLTGVKPDDVSDVVIFDVLGKVVDTQRISGKEGDIIIEEYPAGQYFLRIINKDFFFNFRIIKY